MRSRLEVALTHARNAGRKSLVAFLTAGYPDAGTFTNLALAAQECGCDALEIGVPFSDPSADGPAIQRSSERALAQGMTVKEVISLLTHLRQAGFSKPVVIMSYLNPLLSFGMSAFLEAASRAGADGLLVVDLPHEESEGLRLKADRLNVDLVGMVAPTTSAERIASIVRACAGFVYCVSNAGVTGEGKPDVVAVEEMAAAVRSHTELPMLVGFGVDGPDSAAVLSRAADGVIVGSALLRVISRDEGDVRPFARLLRSLRLALDGAAAQRAAGPEC